METFWETFWFSALAGMLTVYVLLDGFDLGAGAISFLIAKTPAERGLILRAIGPVWDGNEVWLLASGGTLFFAFPLLYAVSFSGFYLPLMMVLWLLMLRAMSIELRSHLSHPLWRSFWDVVFAASSALLAIFLGAALGNIVRGVPLNADKYFFEPLWTDFQPNGQTGILDWYTVLTGVIALIALGVHGALYIAMKTTGEIQDRARRVVKFAVGVLLAITLISLIVTVTIRPELLSHYATDVGGAIFPAAVVAGLAGMHFFRSKGRDRAAFLSSATYLAGMLGGTAFALYPTVLPATTGWVNSLNIHNSAAGAYGLQVGVYWWSLGMVLTLGYFVYLYRTFSSKVTLADES